MPTRKPASSRPTGCAADQFYFRGGGYSSHFIHGTRGGMPVTMARLNSIVKAWAIVCSLPKAIPAELEPDVHKTLDERTDGNLAHHLVCADADRRGCVYGCVQRDGNWGATTARSAMGTLAIN